MMTRQVGECVAGTPATARILVAEDNPLNQALARCYFEQLGYAVEMVENGIEALRLFQLNRYDIVFLDCRMPQLDGYETAQKIREYERAARVRKPVPIIALTADVDAENEAACLAAGMDDCLPKPFTLGQLSEILACKLADTQPGDERDEDKIEIGRTGHCGARDSPASVTFLDQRVLDAIRALETPESPDMLAKIVDTYFLSAQQLLAELHDAAPGDAAAIGAAAHKLKSSSANVGAVKLSEMCRELEILVRQGEMEQAVSLRRLIAAEFELVRRALESESAAG